MTRLPFAIDPNGDFQPHVAPVLGVARTDQVGRVHAIADRLKQDHILAFTRLDGLLGRVERGCAQTAAHVGDTHARKHLAPDRVGWIGTRAAQDCRVNPRRRQ